MRKCIFTIDQALTRDQRKNSLGSSLVSQWVSWGYYKSVGDSKAATSQKSPSLAGISAPQRAFFSWTIVPASITMARTLWLTAGASCILEALFRSFPPARSQCFSSERIAKQRLQESKKGHSRAFWGWGETAKVVSNHLTSFSTQTKYLDQFVGPVFLNLRSPNSAAYNRNDLCWHWEKERQGRFGSLFLNNYWVVATVSIIKTGLSHDWRCYDVIDCIHQSLDHEWLIKCFIFKPNWLVAKWP